MARIRSFKPELFSDHDVDAAGDSCLRLWMCTWSEADDKTGCFDATPLTLKCRAFPLREAVTPQHIQMMLTVLADRKLVRLYQDDKGRQLGQVVGWRHQKINRPSKIVRYPTPEQCARGTHQTLSEPSVSTYAVTGHVTLDEGPAHPPRVALSEPSVSHLDAAILDSALDAADKALSVSTHGALSEHSRMDLDLGSRIKDLNTTIVPLPAAVSSSPVGDNTTQLDQAGLKIPDTSEGDVTFPDGPGGTILAAEAEAVVDLLREQAIQVVRQFREDYHDNVDDAYRFKARISEADIKAAKAYLRSKEWDERRLETLKRHVMLHKLPPRPNNDWKGWAYVVKSFESLWSQREELETKLVRGK